MASSVGIVQLKVMKWRLNLCGTSFLPPPGWIIADMYCDNINDFGLAIFMDYISYCQIEDLHINEVVEVSRLLKAVESFQLDHCSKETKQWNDFASP